MERTLHGLEGSGCHITEGQSIYPLAGPMEGRQKIIPSMIQQRIAERHRRRNQFSDIPFDNAFGLFGVFHLIADRHPQPSSNQTGQILVQRMMGESCQGHFGGSPIRALGQGDSQNFGTLHRVIPKGFVEVPYPEQEHCPGVSRLDLRVLFHQRGFGGVLGGHLEYRQSRQFPTKQATSSRRCRPETVN